MNSDRRLLRFGGRFRGGLDHILQELLEILQARRRDDDRVAPSAHVFGDAEESAARVFLEREHKVFPFNLDFTALQGVFVDRRPGLAVVFGGTVR